MDAARWKIGLNNRGAAIVYIALTLVMMIAMAALVIDLGFMYSVKAQLQNAADAGALAGASRLRGRGLDPYLLANYTGAKKLAHDIVLQNTAAGSAISIYYDSSDATNAGDIVVGCWPNPDDPKTVDTNTSRCKEVNAIQVTVRRTSESGAGINPSTPVPLFLGRILGQDFATMGAKAVAVAVNQKAGFRPMAVNEYWLQKIPPGNRPYGILHNYPNSFVRGINIDGTTSPVFGRAFAVFGTEADNNNNPSNPNGFVALNYRNTNFDGSGTWYKVDTLNASNITCSTCGSGFVGPIATPPMNSNAVKDEALGYLTSKEGYPNTFILPTAIREQLISPLSSYPAQNIPIPTSDCPYATVGYIAGGGQNPTSSTDFKVGDRIVTAVYDGMVNNPGGSNPDVVTFVGYSLIQIDGYSSKNPKNLTDPGFFDGTKHTLYGHALDFVEPPTVTAPPGTCSDPLFINLLEMQYRGGKPVLVR